MDFDHESSKKGSRATESTLDDLSKMLDSPAQKVSNKYVCTPPETFTRKPDTIPFHVPHKKLLEKIEYQKPIPEPLTGFDERQQAILRRRRRREKISQEKDEGETAAKLKKGGVRFIGEEAESESNTESISTGASDIVLPHHKVKGVVKQKDLINQMRNTVDGSFVYMVYAVPRSSEMFTPYALKLVEYENVEKTNFLTMSSHGVTQFICGEMSFTNLNKWEEEYDTYCRLMRIKSFFYFRMWKAYYVWRKGIIFRKYTSARTALEGNLFYTNAHLREALLNIQNMCFTMIETKFCDLSIVDNFYLFYFIEAQ
ncbi:dynein heavy chain 6, axonemal-like, partial [Agrilus planipennis]